MDIKWKTPEKFKDCVIMLGTFMMFMAIIYKRFRDAGLRDLMNQSGVLAEGSVDQALSGKMYNRGIRAYKLLYEALLSLFLDTMEDYCQYDPWNTVFIEELAKKPSTFTIWMTFLDRTEILLNTIHATRAGNWVVLLESYHDTLHVCI